MERRNDNSEDTMRRNWRRWSKGAGVNYARVQPVHDSFSGLMDIRNLVSTTDGDPLRADDDSITFSGTRGTAAAVPPVLLVQSQQHSSAAWKIGIAAVVIAAIALISAAAALMLRTDEQPQFSGSIDTGQLAGIVERAVEEAPTIESFAAENIKPPPEAAASAIAPSTIASPSGVAKSQQPRPRKAWAGRNPVPVHVPAKTTEPAAELEDLLGGATPRAAEQRREKKRSHTETTAADDHPKTLTRAQVQAGLRAVAGKVKRCGKGTSGLVLVDVAIGNSGKVKRASVTGAAAGTKVGKCAARAARKARFPRFSGPQLTVKYPYRL